MHFEDRYSDRRLQEGKVPYLESMVSYGKISSKVWSHVAGFPKASTANTEQVNYLDFQVQRWRESLPPSLQLATAESSATPGSSDPLPQSLQRLQVLLYLRANHLLILIHRHNILSPASIAQNPSGAHLVTSIARDTIRLLISMREQSTIYETQQSSYNYFLVSALAAVFLAVCHDAKGFGAECRESFFGALGLLRDLSACGWSARRLWRSLGGLRRVAGRLGLTPKEGDEDDDGVAATASSRARGRTRTSHSSPETAFSYRPLIQSSSGLTAATPAAERVWNVKKMNGGSADGLADADFEMPDMFFMSSELTNIFEAFGEGQGSGGVDFDGRLGGLLDERDVSALFGDLL